MRYAFRTSSSKGAVTEVGRDRFFSEDFFFGLSGKSAEKRGESEERRLSETCSQASRVSDRPKTGVEEESTVHLARRRFINTVFGALAGALVLDKTADIIDRERKRAPFACFVFTAR